MLFRKHTESSLLLCHKLVSAVDLHHPYVLQAKIRMIEALLADERTLQAREYLELAVQQDKSFAATPIFKELQQKVKQLVRR